MRTIEGPYLTSEEKRYLEKLLCDTVDGVQYARINYAIIGVGKISIEGPPWWRFLLRQRLQKKVIRQLRHYGPRSCLWSINWEYDWMVK